MTDHDRGAYAPPNDAPLAFDPRRAGARRGPPPVTMVLSLMVLAALLVGGFLLYRHGARAPGEAPQVVGAPVGDFKGAPPTSGAAPADSSASLQIYTTDAPPRASSRSSSRGRNSRSRGHWPRHRRRRLLPPSRFARRSPRRGSSNRLPPERPRRRPRSHLSSPSSPRRRPRRRRR